MTGTYEPGGTHGTQLLRPNGWVLINETWYETPSKDQTRELDRMEEQNRRLRIVTADVLALAGELRNGTIERVLGMSDAELGLQTLLGNQPAGRR